ncbi:phage tail tube protein, partial [Pseudomonas syringae]|uniref:phage tail tube protein n=1 Tax=Pseudomonas syringae TaxID=317 RepID=UPI0034D4AA97
MSDVIDHKLYAVLETVRGTTPATPAMSTVRHTSCNLGLSKETFRSEEIRTTRELKDFRHGNRQVGGEFGFELSYGT